MDITSINFRMWPSENISIRQYHTPRLLFTKLKQITICMVCLCMFLLGLYVIQRKLGDLGMNVLDGIPQKVSKPCIFVSNTGGLHAVRPAGHLHVAQHHFRVVHKIGVHPYSIGIGDQMQPIGLNIHQSVTLLAEDNLRCDLRAGSGLEGVVRQPDGAE